MYIKSCQRTRIAPTPSGYLHLGNVFSFTVTAALAHLSGARVLLRIDDIDSARTASAYLYDVFNTLLFLGIPWNDGPPDAEAHTMYYSQHHRMPLYQDALDRLRESRMVFACKCSRGARKPPQTSGCFSDCRSLGISFEHPEVAWRMHTGNARDLVMHTFDGPRTYSFPSDMTDFVVRRKDGLPAYQLCSVVDDVFFGVDLVVRGNDLLNSTLAQLFLANALGYDGFANATFFHHKLLTAGNGDKLSKSAGSSSVQHLAAVGWTPERVTAAAVSLGGLGDRTGWRDILDVVERASAD